VALSVGVVLWKHIPTKSKFGWFINEQDIHVMLDFPIRES